MYLSFSGDKAKYVDQKHEARAMKSAVQRRLFGASERDLTDLRWNLLDFSVIEPVSFQDLFHLKSRLWTALSPAERCVCTQ